jgi:hypothetical protein
MPRPPQQPPFGHVVADTQIWLVAVTSQHCPLGQNPTQSPLMSQHDPVGHLVLKQLLQVWVAGSHRPLRQSLSTAHAFPLMHRGQVGPPQSTSVS